MIVTFNKRFIRELKKINDKRLLKKVELSIYSLEQSDNIKNLPNIKQLKGVKNTFRLKIDTWRIGFIVEDGTIEIQTIQARKDIYKNYP